jgi:hypothetical protein
VEPNRFFLLGLGVAGGGGLPLPSPDYESTSDLSSPGKVWLDTSSSASFACPGGAIDLVGYGASSVPCFEGSGPAPGASEFGSTGRAGCPLDTDNNAADFAVRTPTPRDALYGPLSCGVPTGVALRSRGAAGAAREVRVRWTTASEAGTAGYARTTAPAAPPYATSAAQSPYSER